MKFCTFSVGGNVHFGCELSPGRLFDLRETGRRLVKAGTLKPTNSKLLESADLRGWFSHGREAQEMASHFRQLLVDGEISEGPGIYLRKESRLLAPIQNPSKIVAVGLNYSDHAREQKVPVPERPLLFAKFPTTIIGPDEPIVLPAISQQVDPEAELCIVILERGREFTRDTAKDVAAFMVGNDVSARDLQFSDKQWVRGKSCDTFAPCGPFVVTADDVGNPHSLDIELRLNGRVQQVSNTSNLIFDCYELIRFISESITLEAGDIIFTGTPSGVGVFRDPQIFLHPGDVVEVTIEKLGTLRNPVVAGSPAV